MLSRVLVTGLDFPDVALFVLRVVLGVFFVLARFRWFFDPSRPEQEWLNSARHKHLRAKLCSCGYSEHPLLSGTVATIEVSAGLALIAGLLTMPAAFGLFCILVFATYCTGKGKVAEQNPVDCIDCVSCYLWRVEGVYIMIAACILLLGPGRLSLDWWVFG